MGLLAYLRVGRRLWYRWVEAVRALATQEVTCEAIQQCVRARRHLICARLLAVPAVHHCLRCARRQPVCGSQMGWLRQQRGISWPWLLGTQLGGADPLCCHQRDDMRAKRLPRCSGARRHVVWDFPPLQPSPVLIGERGGAGAGLPPLLCPDWHHVGAFLISSCTRHTKFSYGMTPTIASQSVERSG
jgi:hypothetical protein